MKKLYLHVNDFYLIGIMKKLIFLAALLVAALCLSACRSGEDNEVLAVRLDQTAIELVKGESVQLEATVVPADEDAEIRWFSEDEAYVTVDQTGLVTAVALKKEEELDSSDDEDNTLAVSVFAQYEGGAAECKVTVLPLEPKGLKLVPSQTTLRYGEQALLTVEYEPEDVDIKDVTWSTSNASVAKVKDGVVTAKGYGGCDIIVTYGRIEARAYVFVTQ